MFISVAFHCFLFSIFATHFPFISRWSCNLCAWKIIFHVLENTQNLFAVHEFIRVYFWSTFCEFYHSMELFQYFPSLNFIDFLPKMFVLNILIQFTSILFWLLNSFVKVISLKGFVASHDPIFLHVIFILTTGRSMALWENRKLSKQLDTARLRVTHCSTSTPLPPLTQSANTAERILNSSAL